MTKEQIQELFEYFGKANPNLGPEEIISLVKVTADHPTNDYDYVKIRKEVVTDVYNKLRSITWKKDDAYNQIVAWMELMIKNLEARHP